MLGVNLFDFGQVASPPYLHLPNVVCFSHPCFLLAKHVMFKQLSYHITLLEQGHCQVYIT